MIRYLTDWVRYVGTGKLLVVRNLSPELRYLRYFTVENDKTFHRSSGTGYIHPIQSSLRGFSAALSKGSGDQSVYKNRTVPVPFPRVRSSRDDKDSSSCAPR